jgi:hypothetical protein
VSIGIADRQERGGLQRDRSGLRILAVCGEAGGLLQQLGDAVVGGGSQGRSIPADSL